MTAPTDSTSAPTRCPWCAAEVNSSMLSCPGCGAPVERSRKATDSGWTEMPAVKDMARLRVGNSTCQIEGTYVPVADFNLDASDSVYFSHHVLLWKDAGVELKRMPLKGGWSRMLAGLPLIMAEAHGPGHVAFSADDPGETLALPLNAGQTVHVREHLLLAATGQVSYDWFSTGVWYTTKGDKNTETHYPVGMYMDSFTAGAQPGLLLLHATGNVFVRELAERQTLMIKPRSLIYKDPSVRMGLSMEWLKQGIFLTRVIWLHLCGPGKVAIQSAYEPVEDSGGQVVNQSPSIHVGPPPVPWSAATATHAPAQPPPIRMDPRHALLAKMAGELMTAGEITPETMQYLVQTAAQHGLSEYDVRMIINHLRSHGR